MQGHLKSATSFAPKRIAFQAYQWVNQKLSTIDIEVQAVAGLQQRVNQTVCKTKNRRICKCAQIHHFLSLYQIYLFEKS